MDLSIIKQLPKGEFFKLNGTESAPVWVRDYYDTGSKRYLVYKFEDINCTKWVKGSKNVFVGFTF